MPPFVSTENAVRVPLRTDTDVVIVPDSLAGHFPPIPEAAPVEIEAPSTALVLAPAEPTADADYCRWTASEYIMCVLAVVFVACVVGIVIAAVHVISAVAAAVAAVYTFVISIGGMIVAAGVLALVWRLAVKLSTPSTPGPIAATVTAVAHPVATVTELVKSAPVMTAVAHPVTTVTKLTKGEPVVTKPEPVALQAPSAPERRHWWGGLTAAAKEADRRERLSRLDPRAQQWVQDLRDPKAQQAKGTYDDGSGRYCAVGVETHLHRRMSHQQMGRAFGRNFVHDVEHYNDSTSASFEDVATYIEDNL